MTSQGASKLFFPALNKEPQVTDSGGTPIPKKERADSTNMADAIPKAIETKAGAIPFTSAWLKIIHLSENPKACPA